jgi:hypothetical protein
VKIASRLSLSLSYAISTSLYFIGKKRETDCARQDGLLMVHSLVSTLIRRHRAFWGSTPQRGVKATAWGRPRSGESSTLN